MAITQTERRKKLLEDRLPGENGRWWHPYAPHGTFTGSTIYGCSCEPCLAACREQRRRRQADREHNLSVIRRLTSQPTLHRRRSTQPTTTSPADTSRAEPTTLSLPDLPHPTPQPVPSPSTTLDEPVHPDTTPQSDTLRTHATTHPTPVPINPPQSTSPAIAAPPEPTAQPIRVTFEEPVSPKPPELQIPQMLMAVIQRITSEELLDKVIRAYHTPQWTVSLDEGRERHAYDDVEIIIVAGGPVLAVYERKVEDFTPDVPKTSGVKKAKGGRGGSDRPTTLSELKNRVKTLGCSWENTRNGHIRVLTPNGGTVIVPSTASDWRSIRNGWAQVQRALRG